jgi:serine phosphatase RsbU (regulator of sigma subunit)
MLELPAPIADAFQTVVCGERALAYALVDPALTLVSAGGNLERYGLALQLGQPAASQMLFLEGLLPLAQSPFLIRSLQMPSGSVADVHLFADTDGVWILLLDVTAEHDETRRVQQKAYDMTLLSEREARLISELEAAHGELQRAHRELAASRDDLLRTHRRLEQELREAERYVRSILPRPFSEPFNADWRFAPSTELGGDCFGYHWIDAEHFALYLIDVCGHGVGTALLSVAAADTLRSEALPRVDFRAPHEVLGALNQAFQMEHHNDLFFSIWYGVYHRSSRLLEYASGGHPPAVVLAGLPGKRRHVLPLPAQGPLLGISPASTYRSLDFRLPSPSSLFLFSDGVYEIHRPDGVLLDFNDFLDVLAAPLAPGESALERALDFARSFHGPGPLDDDFTIVGFDL